MPRVPEVFHLEHIRLHAHEASPVSSAALSHGAEPATAHEGVTAAASLRRKLHREREEGTSHPRGKAEA
jgi:hypothetical protein